MIEVSVLTDRGVRSEKDDEIDKDSTNIDKIFINVQFFLPVTKIVIV